MPCIGNVPTIVASQQINQPSGGNISTTTLFTPGAAGTFRVTAYLSCQIINGSITLGYTDALNSRSIQEASNADQTYVWFFDSVASVPITIGTSGNSSGSSYAYNLDVVVEQLS